MYTTYHLALLSQSCDSLTNSTKLGEANVKIKDRETFRKHMKLSILKNSEKFKRIIIFGFQGYVI